MSKGVKGATMGTLSHVEAWTLWGVDFTCAPTRRKPITAAKGVWRAGVLQVVDIEAWLDMHAFERWLRSPGPWLAGFDLPLGLPRAFVDDQQLGTCIETVSRGVHARCATRMRFRALVDAWMATRPSGSRLPHRATDRAASGVTSTSPLQTRYVPVGLMYYEGVRRLLDADVSMPGLRVGRPDVQAVEAYPGLLAHRLIGSRSYKNSDEDSRTQARREMVSALAKGRGCDGLRLLMPQHVQAAVLADPSGDHLDAVLCLVQAAWAAIRPDAGMPADVDPVEGWIVGA